ncbi:MAG: helix-turn-helix domain-containing protein [Actinomycetes bacterium]
MRTSDLLLHPVRLQIVRAFLGERRLTTSQLRAELADVPVASLYRHIGALVDGGVLEVDSERKVRGATERSYRLVAEAARVTPEDLRAMTPEEHRQGFLTFVGTLIADFDRYVARAQAEGDGIDLARDLVGYRQAALHLTDEETADLARELGEVLAPRLALPPGPGRRRRLLSTILMPADVDD